MTLQIVLNGLDLTAIDTFDSQWSIDSFTGWGAVKPTITPVAKPRQPGSWAGLSYDGTRQMVISGQVAAPTQDALTQSLDLLAAAVVNGESIMQVTELSRTRYSTVRRSDEILTAYISDKMASWSVQIIALDPRKLGTALVQATALPSTSGGQTIPNVIPNTIPALTVSGSVTFTNPGNTSGPVLLRIDGPATGPVITHSSSSTTSSLVFASNLTLGAGEYLIVDMENRVALANGQASRSRYITSRGWSGFDPGVNTWAFTAAAYDPSSLLTVTATPAWE